MSTEYKDLPITQRLRSLGINSADEAADLLEKQEQTKTEIRKEVLEEVLEEIKKGYQITHIYSVVENMLKKEK